MDTLDPGFLLDLLRTIVLALVCLAVLAWASTIAVIAWSARLFRRLVRETLTPQEPISKGLLAQATILKTWETGVRLNYNPQIGMLLQVQPPDGIPYQVETKAIVSPLKMSQVQTGAMVPVVIDPEDHTTVALVLY